MRKRPSGPFVASVFAVAFMAWIEFNPGIGCIVFVSFMALWEAINGK